MIDARKINNDYNENSNKTGKISAKGQSNQEPLKTQNKPKPHQHMNEGWAADGQPKNQDGGAKAGRPANYGGCAAA
jgi:hypothetical protein